MPRNVKFYISMSSKYKNNSINELSVNNAGII